MITSQRLKIIFTTTAPATAVWGMGDYVGTGTNEKIRLALALAPDGSVCRIGFIHGEQGGGTLADHVATWQREWPGTSWTKNQAAIDAMMRKINGRAVLPVTMVGTVFQHKVWKAMAHITPGQALSYGGLAKRIGQAAASRAVGGACGANPVPLLVPCHRVVTSTGGLGGFSGGLHIKKRLLGFEATKNESMAA